MFPRVVHEILPDKQVARKKLLVKTLELVINKDDCRNCGVCFNVCPVNSITKGAPGASTKRADKNLTGVIVNPETCSYCGTCTVLCPFGAISLWIDGEPVPENELQLVEKGAIPKLVSKEVTLKDGKKAKQYMDGHLEYDKDTCESGCRTCIEICPTGSLSFQKMEGWLPEKFLIDRDTCMYCGACAFSCPTGSIKIFRDKVQSEGKFTDPFWPNIVQKLLDFHGKD